MTAVLVGIAPAAASGGLNCSAEDQSVKLEVRSGITRGLGNGLFSFQAKIDILLQSLPEELRKKLGQLHLDKSHLKQNWLDEKVLNLDLYLMRTVKAKSGPNTIEVRLLIETKSVEEGDYRGTYVLTIYHSKNPEPLEARGEAACSVE